MSAAADRARDPDAQVEHEAKLATLAAVFSRLAERRRQRCSHPVTGSSLTDTLVLAEAGAWLLDGEFTILTTDNDAEGELILVHGYNCHVDVL